MNKFVTVKEAADKIHDGMTVMVGGFLGVGNPIALIDELVARGVKDLTIICNDTAYPEVGVGKLITNHQVKALIATHIGTNNNTIDQMNAGELTVTLQPQGTLAEQIRAAGAGLGGVLTQTIWSPRLLVKPTYCRRYMRMCSSMMVHMPSWL